MNLFFRIMAGALYYPSWSLNDPVSLGEFLLFWDRLTFMTPSKHWDFPVQNNDNAVRRSLSEAHEKYALPHPPTDKEKAKCDSIIRGLFTADPEGFKKYAAVIGKTPYHIDARKLAYKTVEFLEDHEVFKHFYDDTYLASEAGGHLVMAVLAKCCSSQNLPPVTNVDSQFTLQIFTLDDSLVPQTTIDDQPVSTPSSAMSMLVKRIKLPAAARKDPRLLRQVLAAREQDEVNGYRKAFQDTVMGYFERLTKAEVIAEVDDVLTEFDSVAAADLKRLRRELRAAGIDTVISKDGAVAIAFRLGNSSSR